MALRRSRLPIVMPLLTYQAIAQAYRPSFEADVGFLVDPLRSEYFVTPVVRCFATPRGPQSLALNSIPAHLGSHTFHALRILMTLSA